MCATSGCACDEYSLAPPMEVEKAAATQAPEDDQDHDKPKLRPDFLSKFVQSHRIVLEAVQFCQDKALSYPTIRTLMCTTQPAHLMAAVAVSMVCCSFSSQDTPSQSLGLISSLYVISTALHFGSQFWMTFVSGLTLYFSLSRHAFGDVQQVLFPRYFTLNSLFSCIALLSFAKLHQNIPDWSFTHYVQMASLSAIFLLEAMARLYIAPRVLKTMADVRVLELEVEGVGKEVGRHVPKSLAQSPPYVKAYSAFRKQHGLMAIANVLSISFSTVHIFYLATKINFT